MAKSTGTIEKIAEKMADNKLKWFADRMEKFLRTKSDERMAIGHNGAAAALADMADAFKEEGWGHG